MKDFNFTTGPATLPDVGKLSYNGCNFSPLFTTTLSGTAVKDDAVRTVKLMEYTLEVDGYVTLAGGNKSISPTMVNVVNLITAQAGPLVYKGRGFDLSVNAAGAATFNGMARDVAWGPRPELLEFQPLGGGLSAKVKWRVTVRLVNTSVERSKLAASRLLQFNCETTVTYDEDYYSRLFVRGIMEIPLTRGSQSDRSVAATVDDERSQLDARIFSGIDLSRFTISRREYTISSDKRILNFDIAAEEKPWMDNPAGCTIAHGTFSFRPVRAGMGLCLWLCTLRATYIIRKDQSRTLAWDAFLALLQVRMGQTEGNPITPQERDQNPPPLPVAQAVKNVLSVVPVVGQLASVGIDLFRTLLNAQQAQQNQKKQSDRRALLIDFSGEEGLYKDSKTVTFAATWRLVTQFCNILIHSGLWKKVAEEDAAGNNVWATSVGDVSQSVSWLPNKIDPKLDIIVDFGG